MRSRLGGQLLDGLWTILEKLGNPQLRGHVQTPGDEIAQRHVQDEFNWSGGWMSTSRCMCRHRRISLWRCASVWSQRIYGTSGELDVPLEEIYERLRSPGDDE